MFSNKMIAKKKTLILPIILAVLVVGVALFQFNATFAARGIMSTKPSGGTVSGKTQPIKVVGMAKFVLKGAVVSTTADTITLHVTNTSKNAKLFDNQDKTISVGSKTTITKNGKNILLNQVKSGNKVKVFGIFDKKSGAIMVVRWIKVVTR